VSGDRRSAVRLIGAMFTDLAAAPATALGAGQREKRPFQRPPGSGTEAEFLEECTSCGDCITACPWTAIGVLPEAAGLAAGTPAMNTARAACHLCEDLPCVAACEPGALLAMGPESIMLGLAEVDEDACLPFKGPECGACVPECPLGAITLSRARPSIDSDVCNGCGLCVPACPNFASAISIYRL